MVKHALAAGALALGLAACAQATGPSAECARAAPGSTESLICASPLVSALDAELRRLHRLAGTPAGGGAEQAAAREACVTAPRPETCLRDHYLARIAEIRGRSEAARSADDKGISFGPAAFRCERTDGVVLATFVNTTPPLALITRKDRRLVMQVLPSGSGARYGGPDDQLFWEHHGEARYREGSATPEVTCKQEPRR
jgi:uncharacterized protein